MGADVRAGFRAMVAEGPLLLDGPLGTELLRRGVETPLPLWSAAALDTAPDTVRAIHRTHAQDGARIIVANTFRADRRSLAAVGRANETRDWNRRAVQLAREGVAQARPARPVLIAGSVAPVADCYATEAVPDDRTLAVEHGVRVGHLVAAGAAAAWVETMNTVREAVIALEACRAGNLPAAVSFVATSGGRLLSGEPLEAAVEAVGPLDPLAVLVNCCAPEVATEGLRILRAKADAPVGAYANGLGQPHEGQGWRFRRGVSGRRVLREARRWLDLGADIVGGCCGVRSRTWQRLARLVTARAH